MNRRCKTALALLLSLIWPALVHAEEATVDPSVFADKAVLASDFDALYAEMKATHPDLYRVHERSDWEARYTALKAEIPEMDWPHYVIAMHRFAAMAGDGHTNLYAKQLVGPGFDVRYAVRFALFSDGLYVISASEAIKQAIGGRVVAVNGHPIAEVEAAEAGLTGHGSPMWALAWIPSLLLYPGNLVGLDFASSISDMQLSLATPGGAVIEISVPFESIEAPSKQLSVFDVADGGATWPPWWSQAQPLTYRYWPDKRSVYAIFAHVRNGVVESLQQTAESMFAFIAANDVERLIIDVRHNGGGNNHLLAPLIEAARASKLNRPGGLYVIIGGQTFSAAQNFVNRMENSTQVLFAGEPTGESPNHIGEPETYRLPHTALPVTISTRIWQDSVASDHRIWTMPDIPASMSFDDFVHGRDPVIDAVLAVEPHKLVPVRELSRRWKRPSQRADWPLPIPVH